MNHGSDEGFCDDGTKKRDNWKGLEQWEIKLLSKPKTYKAN